MTDIRNLIHAACDLLEHICSQDDPTSMAEGAHIRAALEALHGQCASFEGVSEDDHRDIALLASELADEKAQALRSLLRKAERELQILEHAAKELDQYHHMAGPPKGQTARDVDRRIRPFLRAVGGPLRD